MRLTKIDASLLADHYYLNEKDNCYFFGEYSARQGFDHSEFNQLIINLKKEVNRRDLEEYKYKGYAIEHIADYLTIFKPIADKVTFVPIPPSKNKEDLEYDDRLVQILELYKKNVDNGDVREMVIQTESRQASHATDDRPAPEALASTYKIDPSLIEHPREDIVIFDDVITSGSHYRAMHSVLSKQFTGHSIKGVFVARRVPKASNPIDLFDDVS